MTAIPAEILQAVECPRCGAPPGQPCSWKIKRPSDHVHLDRLKMADAAAAPSTFRPTFLMERLSRWLQAHPGAHSRSEIVDAVTGKKSALKVALDVLDAEGYIATEEHARGSIVQRNHTFVRLFTEADDTAQSDDTTKPVPPVPNRSQTGPGTHIHQTGPTGPTPYIGGPVYGTGIDPDAVQQQGRQTGPTQTGPTNASATEAAPRAHQLDDEPRCSTCGNRLLLQRPGRTQCALCERNKPERNPA